jgi:3-oxoacyl-[acyl-carrier-protein] synthase III
MAFLRGFGKYLPERIVGNDELAPQLGITSDKITASSGLLERRYAADEETVVSLGHRAALDCMERAGISPQELGFLLVSCGSADRFCPGPASAIAAQLGLTGTPALDLPVASAGSLAGLVLGSHLAASAGHVLVIGTEIMSRRIDISPEGANTAMLFGDGAGAALISPDTGFARIADSCLHSDGNSADALFIKDGRITMNGSVVIRHASSKMPEAMKELLDRNHLTGEEIGTFLLHQANKNLLDRVARTLNAPVERFFTNIERYGNTSSASMLIAAAEWRETNPGPVTAPILFSAFGVGITWGAVLAV